MTGIKKFLHSDYYLLAIGAVVLIGSLFKMSNYGILIGLLAISAILIFCDDITTSLPIIMLLPFAIEPTKGFSTDLITYYMPAIIGFIPLAIAIIYHIIKYSRARKGAFSKPLFIISIAMLLGGVTLQNTEVALANVGWAILLGLFIFLVYYFFIGYCKPAKNLDFPKYICKTALVLAMIVCVQLITLFLRSEDALGDILSKTIYLGWGVSNSIGCLFLITIPLTFYLTLRSKYSFVFVILAIIQFVMLVLTGSRGALLVGCIVTPLITIYTFIKCKNKLLYGVAILIVITIVTAIILTNYEEFNKILSTILDKGLGSTGRTDLYKLAIEHFKNYPIFGVGTMYLGNLQGKMLTWYHSTFFQIIASFGIFGLICFGYKYFVQIKILFKKRLFNFFLIAAFIGYEGYSMIDVMTFSPVPFMMLTVLLIVVCEIANKRENYEKITDFSFYNIITP